MYHAKYLEAFKFYGRSMFMIRRARPLDNTGRSRAVMGAEVERECLNAALIRSFTRLLIDSFTHLLVEGGRRGARVAGSFRSGFGNGICVVFLRFWFGPSGLFPWRVLWAGFGMGVSVGWGGVCREIARFRW